MTKERLKANIVKTFSMGLNELNEWAITVSLSNIDAKGRYFLNKAIAARRMELASDTVDGGGAMAVVSELDPSEI